MAVMAAVCVIGAVVSQLMGAGAAGRSLTEVASTALDGAGRTDATPDARPMPDLMPYVPSPIRGGPVLMSLVLASSSGSRRRPRVNAAHVNTVVGRGAARREHAWRPPWRRPPTGTSRS